MLSKIGTAVKPPLSYSPYLTARSSVINLSVYAGMISVAHTAVLRTPMPTKKGNTRGRVSTFSRKSRKRMIDAMASKRSYNRPLFVTLTFTDECYIAMNKSVENVKRSMDMLNKRLQRFDPGLGHIWRVEFVTRKSGMLQGEKVPHYHLIIDNYLGDLGKFRVWLGDAWSDVLRNFGYTRPARIDVQVAKSRKHAMYYVSKYVAKETDETPNSETKDEYYISEKFHNQNNYTGRHWAIVGNWDTSVGEVVRLSPEQFIQLRRTIRKWAKRRNKRFAQILGRLANNVGFTAYGLGDELFCNDMDFAINRLIEHIKNAHPSEMDIIF